MTEEFRFWRRVLIDYHRCPPRFTTDSVERGIFQPHSATHCTVDQLCDLYADAVWYAQGRKTHDAGYLEGPARAVVRWIETHHPEVK